MILNIYISLLIALDASIECNYCIDRYERNNVIVCKCHIFMLCGQIPSFLNGRHREKAKHKERNVVGFELSIVCCTFTVFMFT